MDQHTIMETILDLLKKIGPTSFSVINTHLHKTSKAYLNTAAYLNQLRNNGRVHFDGQLYSLNEAGD